MSDGEVKAWTHDYVIDNLADPIIDGEVDIPEDLVEILALWGPDGMELCKEYMRSLTVGSRNVRKKGCRRWTTSS